MEGIPSFLLMSGMMGLTLFLYSYTMNKKRFWPLTISLLFSLSLFIISIIGEVKWVMMGVYSISLFIAASFAFISLIFTDIYHRIFTDMKGSQQHEERPVETG